MTAIYFLLILCYLAHVYSISVEINSIASILQPDIYSMQCRPVSSAVTVLPEIYLSCPSSQDLDSLKNWAIYDNINQGYNISMATLLQCLTIFPVPECRGSLPYFSPSPAIQINLIDLKLWAAFNGIKCSALQITQFRSFSVSVLGSP